MIPAILTMNILTQDQWTARARTANARLLRKYPCPVCGNKTKIHFSVIEHDGQRNRAFVCTNYDRHGEAIILHEEAFLQFEVFAKGG